MLYLIIPLNYNIGVEGEVWLFGPFEQGEIKKFLLTKLKGFDCCLYYNADLFPCKGCFPAHSAEDQPE